MPVSADVGQARRDLADHSRFDGSSDLGQSQDLCPIAPTPATISVSRTYLHFAPNDLRHAYTAGTSPQDQQIQLSGRVCIAPDISLRQRSRFYDRSLLP